MIKIFLKLLLNFKFRKSPYAVNFYDGFYVKKSLQLVVTYLFHKGTVVSLKILQEILTKINVFKLLQLAGKHGTEKLFSRC